MKARFHFKSRQFTRTLLVVTVILICCWIGSGRYFMSYHTFETQTLVRSGQFSFSHWNTDGIHPLFTPGFRAGIEQESFKLKWGFGYTFADFGWEVKVPLWLLPMLTAIPATFIFYRDVVARRRTLRGDCKKCGFALGGLAPDAKCPECGKARI